MAANDQNSIYGEIQEARWNAKMDALETNWLTRIEDTRAEYQDERMRLNGEEPMKRRERSEHERC